MGASHPSFSEWAAATDIRFVVAPVEGSSEHRRLVPHVDGAPLPEAAVVVPASYLAAPEPSSEPRKISFSKDAPAETLDLIHQVVANVAGHRTAMRITRDWCGWSWPS
jgi:hypothetical protein